eukprot:354018-Lingulodinium_polyedra.AAC.1
MRRPVVAALPLCCKGPGGRLSHGRTEVLRPDQQPLARHSSTGARRTTQPSLPDWLEFAAGTLRLR